MNPQKLVWFVPLLPLFGFAFNVFIGTAILRAARKRGEGAEKLVRLLVGLVACGTVGASAVISWILFLHVRETHVALEALLGFDWISVGSGHLQVVAQHKLVVDQLTAVMILVVTNVGFLIHVYSTGYMAGEPRYARYFAYLNLFTGFMLILVMAGNLLLMFVGWEGVGLCSYLLISFWYEKLDNAKAGMKAFITNRVGDFAFMIGVMLLFVYIGSITGTWTVDFGELKHAIGQAHKANMIDGGVMTAVGILLFIGATGKSAQIPLYTWLPDAMAGPTPVSALIHAATMVTAGVYMVARMNFVYAMAPWAMGVVALVGAATALFAGTIAVTQNDIKKVLAYSTVSQLGFMFMGVGVGAWAAGIFHLMTHAFFKACLFLGSGSVIHGMHHEQDIRKMGGLRKYMPITFWTFVIATVAIAGVPPFAGFWSKDEILWKAFSSHLPVPGGLLWGLGIAAAAFTAFYMTRLVVLTFFGQLRSAPGGGHGHDHAKTPHESPASMTLPLVVLAALAVVGGFVGTPHWMPQWLGGGVFETWLKPVCPPVESEASQPAGEHHGPPVEELLLMAVSVGIAAAGIGFAWRVYSVKKGAPAKAFVARHRALHEFVHAKYKVDELYDAVVVEPLLEFNEVLARFDNAVVDGAVNGAASGGATASLHTGYFDNEVVDGGVNATAHAVQATGRGLRRLQSGDIRQYLLTALVGGLVVMAAYSLYLRWDQIMTFFGC